MDPDHVVVLRFLRDGLRKELIRFPVRVPSQVVEHNLSGVIMQKGPENGI